MIRLEEICVERKEWKEQFLLADQQHEEKFESQGGFLRIGGDVVEIIGFEGSL